MLVWIAINRLQKNNLLEWPVGDFQVINSLEDDDVPVVFEFPFDVVDGYVAVPVGVQQFEFVMGISPEDGRRRPEMFFTALNDRCVFLEESRVPSSGRCCLWADPN